MVARVLVVEDNDLNLKLIKDVLEYQGFDVLTAASGEEGVLAALSESPDLVLMDLQLPGIDGHEALLRIRADPRRSRTPVIAVTAFAMKEDVERAPASTATSRSRSTYMRYRGRSPASCPANSMADPITVLAVDDQPQSSGGRCGQMPLGAWFSASGCSGLGCDAPAPAGRSHNRGR
jgi:CheY-like chemotaxis protein